MLLEILKLEPSFNCLGCAKNGKQAIQLIEKLIPDIVLMDIGLPDISGIECVSNLKRRFPQIEFMMCTIFDDEENIAKALTSGASSYFIKNSDPLMLIEYIKELKNGGAPMSNEIARKLLNQIQKTKIVKGQVEFQITKRQDEILILLSQGLTYQEIADKLFIDISTLRKHIYTIYQKLHVNNKIEAVNTYFGKN